MVNVCIYCGVRTSTGSGRTFHAFPKDPQKMEMWIKTSGLEAGKITKWSRLCSDHFEHRCFPQGKGYNISILVKGAVPTIFGDRASKCVYCGGHRNRANKRSLHRFPFAKPEILQKWLASIPIPGFVPTPTSVLCSDHFEACCFFKPGSLRRNAVPAIFLTGNDIEPRDLVRKPETPSAIFIPLPLNEEPLPVNEEPLLVNEVPLPINEEPLLIKEELLPVNEELLPIKEEPLPVNEEPLLVNEEPLSVKEASLLVIEDPLSVKEEPFPVNEEPLLIKEEPLPVNEEPLSVKEEPLPVKEAIMENVVSQPGGLAASTGSGQLKTLPEKFHLIIREKKTPSGTETISQSGDANSFFLPKMTTKKLKMVRRSISSDHCYEDTPRTTRKKLDIARRQLVKLRKQQKNQKQQIKRMAATINNLQDIVSTLR